MNPTWRREASNTAEAYLLTNTYCDGILKLRQNSRAELEAE